MRHREAELIELRNRFILGLIVAVVFAVPVALFFFNRYGDFRSDVLKSLNEKKTMVIFFTNSNSCDSCDDMKKILDQQEVSYLTYDISKSDDYAEIRKKISLSEEVIVPPGIVYVKKGEMSANLFRLTEKELLSFLKYHELSHTVK